MRYVALDPMAFSLPAPGEAAEATPADEQVARLTGLVRALSPVVFRALRRLGLTPSDAEDAAQEVFLVVSRKLAAVERGSERAFALATAVRVASTRRRSARRRPEVLEASLDDRGAAAPSPEDLSALGEARALLERTLASMDDGARAVFVLHELEQLSTRDIAEALAIPAGTVSTRLRRAREVFRAAAEAAARRAAERGATP